MWFFVVALSFLRCLYISFSVSSRRNLLQTRRRQQWTWLLSSWGYGQPLINRHSRSWSRMRKAQFSARPFILPTSWSTCWYPWIQVRTSCWGHQPLGTGRVEATALSQTGGYPRPGLIQQDGPQLAQWLYSNYQSVSASSLPFKFSSWVEV